MKTKLYTAVWLVLSTLYCSNIFGQANTKLSNLVSPTAVNLNLLPGANNTLTLGNGGFGWKSIYLGTNLYLKNVLTMQAPGTTNFFVGPLSGNTTATATYNTGVGYNTLGLATSGGYNTAVGHTALRSNTTGSKNCATGYVTLYSNTTGSYNTGNGERSLYKNTTGSYNTSSGEASMYTNTTGYYNSAYGFRSLFGNTSGYYNTASGYQSLYTNTTGAYNTVFGENSMYANLTGSYNVSVGSEAMYSSTGSYNVASGYQTLYYNRSSYNTSSGAYALNGNTTGSFNTGSGFASLYLNTSGAYNTGLGAYSLYSNVSGSGNSGFGYFADLGSSSLTNATSVGYNAVATASNQVMLGNSSVISVKAAGSVVIYSDGRFKKEVQANVPGLEFIKQLHPVTYHYDVAGMNAYTGAKSVGEKIRALGAKGGDGNVDVSKIEQAEKEAITQKEKKLYTGFIAQEVEATAKKLNYDFNGVYIPQNDKDLYGLSYESFVVPMVKAMQELAQQNDSLKLQSENMQVKFEELIKKLDKLEALVTGNGSNNTLTWGGSLNQNKPNPVKGSTVIGYSLPQTFTTATIVLYDMSGKKLKQINVSGQGNNTVQVNTSALPPGTYNYSLFVNGAVVDTKKMVLIK